MKHIVLLILLVFTAPVSFACTGFFKEVGGEVYFAANEDWFNPYTKIWTIPGDKDNYGLFIMGYANMFPQTIINDQGLVVDYFSSDELEVQETKGKKSFEGDLFLEVFKKCATVEEALEMISEYKLEFFLRAQALIGDKTGDSALIEGDVIHRKEGSYQVATNFNLSNTEYITCKRFNLASQFLDDDNFSDDDLRTILERTKQPGLTKYSYIFNITKGTMELFFFGDYENSKTFNINEELNKIPYNIDMPELFENNFYIRYLTDYHRKKPRKSEDPITGISKYIGYYYISAMKKGYEIIESDGSLKIIMDGYEFEMIPSTDDLFFFKELDYTLHFQRKSSTKIYGVNVEHPYFDVNGFAKKIHPFWAWFYKF